MKRITSIKEKTPGTWEINGELGFRYYTNSSKKDALIKYKHELKHHDPAGLRSQKRK